MSTAETVGDFWDVFDKDSYRVRAWAILDYVLEKDMSGIKLKYVEDYHDGAVKTAELSRVITRFMDVYEGVSEKEFRWGRTTGTTWRFDVFEGKEPSLREVYEALEDRGYAL